MAAEKRKDLRRQREFLIWYRPATDATALWRVSPLRDISKSGAHFLSEQPFEISMDLTLRFLFPFSTQPLIVPARVAWVKVAKTKTWQLMECGVTFEAATPQLQSQIDRMVEQFLSQQELSPASAERRRRPRLDQPFHATYQALPASPTSGRHSLSPINLSAVGMRFLSAKPLPAESQIELSVLPPNAVKAFLLVGRVAWGKQHPSGVGEYGVEFVNVTSEQRVQITELLALLANPQESRAAGAAA